MATLDREGDVFVLRLGTGENRFDEAFLSDLERAGEDQVLVDAREGTLVVVGERGRTHFFNAEGKLVTSVRYPPSAIARRRRTGRWAAAPRERIDRLRESLGQL